MGLSGSFGHQSDENQDPVDLPDDFLPMDEPGFEQEVHVLTTFPALIATPPQG